MFKKVLAALAVSIIAISSIFALTLEPKAMSYRTVDEVYGMISRSEDFLLLDLRMPEDYGRSHINVSLNLDMTAAMEGDYDTGVKVMREFLLENTGSTNGNGKTIVLACYTGNRYAQAATNVLAYLGADMSKVYTLKGGNTEWSKSSYAYMMVSGDDSYCSVNGFDAVEIGHSGSVNEAFAFARRRGDSELDMTAIIDIMKISTQCSFESYSIECGYLPVMTLTEKYLLDETNGEKVELLRNGTLELTFVNGHKASGLYNWPSDNALVKGIEDPMGKFQYCVFDDEMFVALTLNLKYDAVIEYCQKLSVIFRAGATLMGDGKSVSFEGSSSDRKATASFNGKEFYISVEKI